MPSMYAAIWILASLAVIAALRFGRALFVPLIVGLLLSYVLDPIVAWLVGRGIKRGLAAAIVFVAALAAIGATGYSMSTQASMLVARLPGAAQEIRRAVEKRTKPGPIEKVQEAANELHQLSTTGTTGQVQKVEIAAGSFDVAGYLWANTAFGLSLAADVVVVLALALFLLAEGGLFRRLSMEVAGPTLTQKKITVQILNDISAQISRYLFLRVLISVIVAILTGLALWATGLAQPAVWGLVAGLLNVIPYAGPITAIVAIGIAALLQFHTLTMPSVIVLLTALVALLEGYIITPVLTSRAAQMNAVAVFVGLAFWGWLWGWPGLLLAVPLMMILKAVGEQVEALRPFVVFLRAAPKE